MQGRNQTSRSSVQGFPGFMAFCFPCGMFKTEIRSEQGPISIAGSWDSGGFEDPGTVLTVADVYKATGNFHPNNIIQRGGSGTTYKGRLKDGSIVAVKQWSQKRGYGHPLAAEVVEELRILSEIQHASLVRFHGIVANGNEYVTVSDYFDSGTLREHLDGLQGHVLDLGERLNIAVDVAHGIGYLHDQKDHPIVHGHITSSNIFLTNKLKAKVAIYEGAYWTDEEEKLSEVIRGNTPGYMDPEYIRTYKLTEKSDVYSFGALLVELMTGRHLIEHKGALDELVVTEWAIGLFKEGEVVIAMDPVLVRNPLTIATVEKCMALAMECLAPSQQDRPSMVKCTEVLWAIRRDYHRQLEMSTPAPYNAVDEWIISANQSVASFSHSK